jgi:hypothetical protein
MDYWKVVEIVEDGACLDEVGHPGHVFEGYILSWVAVASPSPPPLPLLPLTPSLPLPPTLFIVR